MDAGKNRVSMTSKTDSCIALEAGGTLWMTEKCLSHPVYNKKYFLINL